MTLEGLYSNKYCVYFSLYIRLKLNGMQSLKTIRRIKQKTAIFIFKNFQFPPYILVQAHAFAWAAFGLIFKWNEKFIRIFSVAVFEALVFTLKNCWKIVKGMGSEKSMKNKMKEDELLHQLKL